MRLLNFLNLEILAIACEVASPVSVILSVSSCVFFFFDCLCISVDKCLFIFFSFLIGLHVFPLLTPMVFALLFSFQY